MRTIQIAAPTPTRKAMKSDRKSRPRMRLRLIMMMQLVYGQKVRIVQHLNRDEFLIGVAPVAVESDASRDQGRFRLDFLKKKTLKYISRYIQQKPLLIGRWKIALNRCSSSRTIFDQPFGTKASHRMRNRFKFK